METEKFELQEKNKVAIVGSTDGSVKPLSEIILDFFSVIAKWRRLLMWFVLLTTATTIVITFLSPKWYKASARVFPAEQTSLFPGLEGISSVARTFGVGGTLRSITGSNELDRYLAILKSESALMKVIERFDLTRLYEITSYPREKTLKELISNTEFEIEDEGGLSISVYDKDPERAANMANYFVQVLNETNSRMQAQNARANREFIEQRVEKCQLDLHASEEAFKDFQEKTGILIVPQQASSSVSAAAELYVMKARKEVELGILQKTVSKDNLLLRQTRLELAEIQKKVDRLPEAGIGGLRLYRDVTIQQKILEFLLPLYEQTKVEEKRSTPSVVVLDEAAVPERKAKPKISLYALMAFVVSSLLSLFFIFSAEGVARIHASNPERFNNLVHLMRSDWFGLRIGRNAK